VLAEHAGCFFGRVLQEASKPLQTSLARTKTSIKDYTNNHHHHSASGVAQCTSRHHC
jgi:hypothetical protein